MKTIITLFFLASSSLLYAEDDFSNINIFATVGVGASASVVSLSTVGMLGRNYEDVLGCYDAEVGVMFLKYLGVVGGYAGCASFTTIINRAKLMLLLQKKMDVNSWGFRPYLSAGANYSWYTLESVYKDSRVYLDGVGFSIEAGLRFQYHMFLIGINVNTDTTFGREVIRYGERSSDFIISASGGLKVGVVF